VKEQKGGEKTSTQGGRALWASKGEGGRKFKVLTINGGHGYEKKE